MAKLYIVGTPIGNMEDITLRAINTLKKVTYIACEDTRVTRKILNHFDIKDKKLIVHNNINEKNSSKGVIQIIKNGQDVAQVSDAGMPIINDPGFLLIREAIEEKIEIEIIPGVSAVTTTIALSNFNTNFTFHGFFKYKKEQRKNQLRKLGKGTHIFFASPHRIEKELQDIVEIIGTDAKVFLGRELTKKFETVYRGNINDVIEKLDNNYKGEFSIAIEITKKGKDDRKQRI